jgi:cytochrome c peroxidase
MDRQEAILAGWLGASPTAGVPPGVDPSFWRWLLPPDNLPGEARVALGRKLYFDPRLSRDGTVACATCHDTSRGFTDRRSTSEGIRDQVGKRNAPTTLNAVFFSSQFWDGRAASLDDQATLPIVNPIEMGQPDGNAAAAAISGDAEYRKAFQSAYGRPVNYQDIGRAIASFERTLVFVDAPFDRFAGGAASAVSDEARAGWALFNGKARCTACHQLSASSPVGTDGRFHNIGVSARHQEFEKLARKAVEVPAKDSSKDELDRLALETDVSELGRFVVTRNPLLTTLISSARCRARPTARSPRRTLLCGRRRPSACRSRGHGSFTAPTSSGAPLGSRATCAIRTRPTRIRRRIPSSRRNSGG